MSCTIRPRQDLGAGTGDGIAAGAEGEEAAVAFRHQEDGVRDAKVARHSVEHNVRQLVQVPAPGEVVTARTRARQERHVAAGGLGRGRKNLFDVDHPEDIRAEEPENLLQPVMRGYAGELRLHRLEERPRGARLDVVEIQSVLRERVRIEDLDARLSGRQEVAASLVEELVG